MAQIMKNYVMIPFKHTQVDVVKQNMIILFQNNERRIYVIKWSIYVNNSA